MNGTLSRQDVLRDFLRRRRRDKDITQHQLAAKMGRYRSFVTAVETGQHRVSLLEFLDFAEALEFDPCAAIRRVRAGKR
jgi:transcriptional regulator with XRE-family HTH domain